MLFDITYQMLKSTSKNAEKTNLKVSGAGFNPCAAFMSSDKPMYKRGDIGQDGRVFWRRRKADNWIQWVTPAQFAVMNVREKEAEKRRRMANRERYLAIYRRYYQKNAEKRRASAKEYAQRNREKIKAREMRRRIEDPKAVTEKYRRYYRKNRRTILAKGKEYVKRNAERCRNRDSARYWKRPEFFRQQARAWRKRNPERMKESCARYRKENRDKVRAQSKRWGAKNIDLVREYRRKRKALVKNAIPIDYDVRQLLVMEQWRARVEKCIGVEFHLDHIKPLSRGGTHTHRNLQILPAVWNARKNAHENYPLPDCYRRP